MLLRTALALLSVGIAMIGRGLPAANAQASYTVFEITTLSGIGTRVVRGVSDAGDVAGGSKIGSALRAFVAGKGGSIVFVGPPGSDYSAAMGINSVGDVIGSANTATAVRAFRSSTSGGGVSDLGTLPGDTGSQAFAINARGQVVGVSSGPTGTRAVIWERNGAIRELPTISGARGSRALAINEPGDAVGVADTTLGPQAVAWKGATVRALGTLPGHRASQAVGINNQGEIVGYSEQARGIRHAVLWSPGAPPQDLGALTPGGFTVALGINDLTQVVGSSETTGGLHAFLWTAQTGIRDLNAVVALPAGIVLTQAAAISTQGTILAVGHDEGAAEPGHAHDVHELPLKIFVLEPHP
jgi:probable HAF family extracellular repeat protein